MSTKISKYFSAETQDRLEILSDWFGYKLRRFSEKDPWLASAKNLHRGERCFVLGGGPSLKNFNLSRLKGEICFGVNSLYKCSDQFDITYFVYVSNWWWKHHLEGLRNVRCQRRFIPKSIPELASDVPTSWLEVIPPKYFAANKKPLKVPAGWSYLPDRYIFSGGTVLFLCFQLAYYMGFQSVIVLGLDHSYDAGKDHLAKRHHGYMHKATARDAAHFDEQYVPNTVTNYHVDLEAMERAYDISNRVFLKNGRRVVNATPGTRLKIFETANVDDILAS